MLCCAVLCCAVLCCAVLCCAVLVSGGVDSSVCAALLLHALPADRVRKLVLVLMLVFRSFELCSPRQCARPLFTLVCVAVFQESLLCLVNVYTCLCVFSCVCARLLDIRNACGLRIYAAG